METTAERLALLIEHYVKHTPGNWQEKLAVLQEHIDPATLEEFVSWTDDSEN